MLSNAKRHPSFYGDTSAETTAAFQRFAEAESAAARVGDWRSYDTFLDSYLVRTASSHHGTPASWSHPLLSWGSCPVGDDGAVREGPDALRGRLHLSLVVAAPGGVPRLPLDVLAGSRPVTTARVTPALAGFSTA
jgi:hypothetical protein